MTRFHFLAASLAAFSSAQSTSYPTRFDNVTWDNDNWILKTTNLEPGLYQTRQSLANGYIGISLANAGPFFEVDTQSNPEDNSNGWPLFDRRQAFAGVSGFFDRQATTNGTNYPWLLQYGDESVISGLPHWSGLEIEAGGSTLNASVDKSSISGFSSSMDHKRALLQWQYVWTATQDCRLSVNYSMFVNKLYVNRAAVQANVTLLSPACSVMFRDTLVGEAAVRSNHTMTGTDGSYTILSAVSPYGVPNVTAVVYSTTQAASTSGNRTETSNSSSISQTSSTALTQGQSVSVAKFIGIASSDAFANPQDVARQASMAGAAAGFSSQFAEHAAEWASILSPDSIDDYTTPSNGSIPNDTNILELQITSVTNPFHLLQNTVGPNAIIKANNNTQINVNSISVGGLASSSYAGLVFWDVEVWMAPGLQVSHPAATLQIAKYRVEKYAQAQANIGQAYTSSQNGTGKYTSGGAVYPWTSGRYGNCTGTGPCWDYEYHINGDIGLEMYNYLATSGDWEYFQQELFPIYDSIAHFYSQLLTLNDTTGKYTILNATDPDEYANNKNDPGFTLVLVKTHLQQANEFRQRFGTAQNETWNQQIPNILIPVDTGAEIIVEYQGMNGTVSVKQADIILIDDLLEYPNQYSLNDLDYYAGKQSLDGPGMTYSSFSIVANEISPSGCSSYTYQLQGSQPYIRAPWFQFSEQLTDGFSTNGGTHPAYPFLTGMGGANRVAVFGYLGLRLMVNSLNVDPSLPPEIQHLTYRTIHWQGHAIKAVSNQTHTTLRRTGVQLPTANKNYTSAAIPVTIGLQGANLTLPVNGSLTIPNRQIGNNKTVAGNIAQCQSATSTEPYVPGQFPLAAIDGAISTKWQPARANISSHLIVSLPGPAVLVRGFQFDFGSNPPRTLSIAFSNSSTDFGTNSTGSVITVLSGINVAISTPYNVTAVNEITPYMSNSTYLGLGPPVYSGRYARLTIEGTQATVLQNGTGATIAEWAIIAADGAAVNMQAPAAVRRWESAMFRPRS